MPVVEKSILINASPDAVDAVSLDANQMPEWYVGIAEAIADDVYPAAGGVVEAKYKVGGMSFDMTMKLTKIVRGDYGLFELTGMITGTNRWVYQEEGSGTRVTAIFKYEMPGGALGAMANKIIVERMNNQNLEQSLANLKALIEG